MIILFFEVRSKTALYQKIAEQLRGKIPGLEVHWIVQNKVFLPKDKAGIIHQLIRPVFNRASLTDFDELDEKITSCDRFSLHYRVEPWYYRGYRHQIEGVFDLVKPDFVFGELGNFFTHYGALISKKYGIPFYDIETSRFPTASVSFFEYDTWKPVKLKSVSDTEVSSFVDSFLENKPVPDYMKKESEKIADQLRLANKKITHRIKTLLGYVKGDKFCTQNPILNYFEKKKVDHKISLWKSNSLSLERILDKRRKIILYPLQMQPEFNLEVWGYPNNDQLEVIAKIATSLPEGWLLVIKANPKSYFELNRLRFAQILRNANTCLLNLDVTMREIDPYVDMVVTVTGTVQIERLLNNRPVYILGDTPFSKYSCINLNIDNVRPEDFSRGCDSRLSDFQIHEIGKFLLEHSVKGIMSEPASNLYCMNDENIEALSNAFHDFIMARQS